MSTPGNKNPYVTGGINKNLLTPCRPLGLSRKRKTPASGVKTPLLNSPALISTPKAENSYTENGTPLVSTRNKINNVTDSGKAKKKKISKRLAMDVENNENDVNKGVEQKIDSESDDDLPLVKTKTKKEDVSKNQKNPVKTTIETTKEIKPNVDKIKPYDKNKKDPANARETKQSDDIPLVKAKPKKKPVKTMETTKEIKPKVDKTKIYNENKIDTLKLKETNEEMQQKEVIKPTCHNKTSNIVQEIQNKYDSDDLPLKIKIKLDNDVNKIKIIKNENIQKMDTETSSDDIPIFIKRKIKKDIEKACVNSDSDNESLLSIKKQEENVINSDLSPKTVNKHKPKKYISSDSEDDFQVNSKSTQKTYSRIKVKADIHQESKTKFKKVDSVESDIQKLQEIEKNMTCKVHLELLSGSHIKSLLSVGQDNVITSTQVDADKVESFDKVINKHKPLIILQKNYNEDDDFACSPNDDKFDKGDTLKKIKYLELSNKGKKEKLAKLKQAEVYKNLHNVGELENLTKIWTNGCKLALEDLLKQLQAHGPMDMPMLLRKLNIPEKISNKFKFSSESN